MRYAKTLCLVLCLPRLALAGEDQGARAFLLGDELGALSNPAVLTKEDHVKAMCEALQDPRAPVKLVEKGALPLSKADRIARYKRVRGAVYKVQVPSKRFRFGEYRFDESKLPLKVEHAMSALDGALGLSVMDRRGAEFSMEPEAAKLARRRKGAGELALELTFLIDSGSLGPCYSYQKSEVYSLRIVPLTYALVEAKGGAELALAKVQTPAFEELREDLGPGAPQFQISVSRLSGQVSEQDVWDAVQQRRGALEACMAPLSGSSVDTGMVAVGLELSPLGAVSDARVVMASQSAEGMIRCVLDGLRGLRVDRAQRAGQVQVLVSVDRS